MPGDRSPGPRILAAFYLLLLWVLASGLSRGQGFWLFVGGLGPLAISCSAARNGFLFRLTAIALGCTVAVVSVESVLRLRPEVLSGYVADIAYTGYHWQRSGIYRLDQHLGPDLRPDFRRTMYWAGHWWHHQTNADGYRGPRLERAEAVVLGDSLVYGHGVDLPQTLAQRLAELASIRVANLGQQGTCLLQSLHSLQRKGLPLEPEVVFVASNLTDVEDATIWYHPEQLRRFLRNPSTLPVVRPEYQPASWWNPVSAWARFVALPFRSAGIPSAALHGLGDGRHRLREQSRSDRPAPPSRDDLERPFPASTEPERLGWRVHVRALTSIVEAARDTGARVVLFDLGYPYSFSSAIETLAAKLDVEYSPAGRIALERALAGEHIYLVNDGHWSAHGNDVVARSLAKSVIEQNNTSSPEREQR